MPAAQEYYYKIRTCLARMWAETYIDSASNLQDSKIFCENVIKDLLNDVYDWNLINGNQETYNVGGFDLKDDSNKVLVQVSSTTTKDKVNNSIEKSDIDEFSGYRLIMFGIGIGDYPMIYEKTGGYTVPAKITFDKDNDRWTIRTISKEIQGITDILKLERISNRLESQYGKVEKWNPPKKPIKPENASKLYKWACDNYTSVVWEPEDLLEDSTRFFNKLKKIQTLEMRTILLDIISTADYENYDDIIKIPQSDVTSIIQSRGYHNCFNVMQSFSDKSLTTDPESSNDDGYFYICPGDDRYYLQLLHSYLEANDISLETIIIDLNFSVIDE